VGFDGERGIMSDLMPAIARIVALALGVVLAAGCAGGTTEASTEGGGASTSTAPSSSEPAGTPSTIEPTSSTTVPPSPTTTEATPPPSGPPCSAVAHFGDSTSVGMVSTSYLPNPAQRLDAQYARVGFTEQHLEIDGARSIVETHHGSPNARDTALRVRDAGFRGCWIFALGTTDAANVGAGSNFGHDGRIDRMMAVAASDPVLWVKVKTLVPSGAWSNENMQAWNRALDAAATRYTNLQIYDWPAVVQDSWFEADGIHYTSQGFAERARLIADAALTLRPIER
jgi:hypothetical protein